MILSSHTDLLPLLHWFGLFSLKWNYLIQDVWPMIFSCDPSNLLQKPVCALLTTSLEFKVSFSDPCKIAFWVPFIWEPYIKLDSPVVTTSWPSARAHCYNAIENSLKMTKIYSICRWKLFFNKKELLFRSDELMLCKDNGWILESQVFRCN